MLIHINNYLLKKAMALKLDGIFISCVPRVIKMKDGKSFTINEGIVVSNGRPEFVQFLEDESQNVKLGEIVELEVYPKNDSYNKRVILVEKK